MPGNCPGSFWGTTGIHSGLMDICDQYEDISSQDYIYIVARLDSARLTFFPGSQVLMASSPSDAHESVLSILVDDLCVTLHNLPVPMKTLECRAYCNTVLAQCLDDFGLWNAYISDYPDLLVVGKIILNQAMSSELLTADEWEDHLGDQDTFSQVVIDGHTWFSLSSVKIHIWIWQPGDTGIILDRQEGEGYAFGTVYLTAHLDDINKAFWHGFCLLKETIVHELEKISDLLDPNALLKKKPYSATKHQSSGLSDCISILLPSMFYVYISNKPPLLPHLNLLQEEHDRMWWDEWGMWCGKMEQIGHGGEAKAW
ncbi:hypothetical protein EDC04DRAFT_2606544 [Pisolithus marmoratus]|nr:hypothetical protein EDC04DRAFT_2606544 [Pisolithus marmoratus]